MHACMPANRDISAVYPVPVFARLRPRRNQLYLFNQLTHVL
jgi:hypothetical protein